MLLRGQLRLLKIDRGTLCRHRLNEVRNAVPPMIFVDRHNGPSWSMPSCATKAFAAFLAVIGFECPIHVRIRRISDTSGLYVAL